MAPGAGTGKFTPGALETGSPVAAMRAKLAAALLEVDIRSGTAQSLPLDDAIVCAQAFHCIKQP
ncbi:class I SAM-dependent methyltransferase [Paraburkholderia sp. CNPSo 3274]|uniref:class I SAM-dependent methyltransferase n=1 Tax=Paraburkholderia sp. CNPSo 3274 TaxID=2940932 RepID=UPI0020B76643|nr:class I SAM-dependent methyltransferase [Paraburkholderia sp. CNPSo 3274]MCP3710354.1 class I SAM-dependent methyltransferase [Paraburkholderia sp. CNPSo 3274]